MDVSTSEKLAETYLQHMEYEQICPLLIKHQIAGCIRYVDNTVVIYIHN
jgi:hypothetical protein